MNELFIDMVGVFLGNLIVWSILGQPGEGFLVGILAAIMFPFLYIPLKKFLKWL